MAQTILIEAQASSDRGNFQVERKEMETDTGYVKTAGVKNKPWKIVIDIVVVLPVLNVH